MTENPSQDRTPRYGEQDPPQNPDGQGQYGQGQDGRSPYGQDGGSPYGQAPFQSGQQQPGYPQQNADGQARYGQTFSGPGQGGQSPAEQYGYGQYGHSPNGHGQGGQYGQSQYGQGQYGQDPYGAPQYQGGAPMPSYQGQTPAQAAGPAPQSVRRGALLVYIACGIGVVGAVLLALPVFQAHPGTAVSSLVGNLVVFALGIAGAILTVKGHNWARITSLVFACLGIIRLVVGLFGMVLLFTDPVPGIGWSLQALSTALYMTGVVFFWLVPSSLWFRSRGTVMY